MPINPRVLLAFVASFVLCFAWACGPEPVACNASSCSTGCCDENGECLAGTALFECGAGGAACARCEANLACNAGQCTLIDGGVYDASFPNDPDGGFNADAGRFDAGLSDAGPMDAGRDAGPVDAGQDAGPMDAGPDAGMMDAGVDAGVDAGTDAGTAMDAGVDAGPPLSFAADVQPLFDTHCGGCHGWTHSTLVNVVGAGCTVQQPGVVLVAPSNTADSMIWRKMTGSGGICGGPMPQGTAGLSTDNPTAFGIIERWILQGAPNN